ncbi:MAG: hypothetical protein O2V44_08390 [Candidatus Bathyarchaeota archaeon]|nr:hypothetical protein [Candidatus Bathyarchaeota archaeon]
MTVETNEGINRKKFNVVVFGSARIEPGDPNWYLIYDLAKGLAAEGIDLVTGGGPDLMDAASVGHHAEDISRKALSIALQIKLPKEQRDSTHLDIKKKSFLAFLRVLIIL